MMKFSILHFFPLWLFLDIINTGKKVSSSEKNKKSSCFISWDCHKSYTYLNLSLCSFDHLHELMNAKLHLFKDCLISF